MKVIIAGSRSITDRDVVYRAIADSWFNITEVVSGCAAGVDTFGEVWASEHNIPVKKFPANWKEYGRAAGPIRNRHMAEYGDALIAIIENNSRGTTSMIKNAKQLGLNVFIVHIPSGKSERILG